MNDVCKLILSFTFYSFLGWVCETVYCSVNARKFINRGFLNGPFCPVYGIGALLVVKILSPFERNIAALFILGMFLTSLLEYITAYLLEKLFHTKWWDYSTYKFNIHGRVCLKNSLMFGALSVIMLTFINPMAQAIINKMTPLLVWLIAVILLVYFIVDTAVTVHTILQINGKLAQMEELRNEFAEKSALIKARLYKSIEAKLDIALDAEIKDRLEWLSQRLNELGQTNKHLQRRLINAFPNMTSIRHNEALLRIKDNIRIRKKKQ